MVVPQSSSSPGLPAAFPEPCGSRMQGVHLIQQALAALRVEVRSRPERIFSTTSWNFLAEASISEAFLAAAVDRSHAETSCRWDAPTSSLPALVTKQIWVSATATRQDSLFQAVATFPPLHQKIADWGWKTSHSLSMKTQIPFPKIHTKKKRKNHHNELIRLGVQRHQPKKNSQQGSLHYQSKECAGEIPQSYYRFAACSIHPTSTLRLHRRPPHRKTRK